MGSYMAKSSILVCGHQDGLVKVASIGEGRCHRVVMMSGVYFMGSDDHVQ